LPGDAGLLVGACLLGGPVFAQMTDFCSPGQSGVPACPCNNAPSSAGAGCANFGPGQIGQSAKLAGLGSPSVGNDTLQFQAVGENDVVLSVFYQSDSSGTPSAFGAGVTCLPANPLMLYHGMSGTGEPMGQITRPRTGIDPSITARSATLGNPIAAGSPGSTWSLTATRRPRTSRTATTRRRPSTRRRRHHPLATVGP
jgi:hypothetical protein